MKDDPAQVKFERKEVNHPAKTPELYAVHIIAPEP